MLIRKWRPRKAVYWELGAAITTADIENWNYRNTNQHIISLLVQPRVGFTYLWERPNVVPSEHQRPIEPVDVTWRIGSGISSREETWKMKQRVSCNPGLCSLASSRQWGGTVHSSPRADSDREATPNKQCKHPLFPKEYTTYVVVFKGSRFFIFSYCLTSHRYR